MIFTPIPMSQIITPYETSPLERDELYERPVDHLPCETGMVISHIVAVISCLMSIVVLAEKRLM